MTELPAPRPGKGSIEPTDGQSPVPVRPILEARSIHKIYTQEDGSELPILAGVEIAIAAGEAVAIIGASGSGKSTFLHLLGGLDRPTSGEVILAGRNLSQLPDRDLAEVRNARVGFVFQFHHLLREFTALENVMMPMLVGGRSNTDAKSQAAHLLGEVGLSQRLTHKPWQLSGGEQQRVAVARALANSPTVVIADEPSGNLDTHTAEQLHELFFRLRSEHGIALVLATHNRELADRADRILQLKEGQLRSFYPA
jgi:lipoprotein-releasing system ATP-binding protein